jgi:bacterioferritin
MKGQEQVISHLNELLADELSAINQYFVHAEMCEDWGYEKLHEAIRSRAIQEMKHAERLIARILFLDGRPIVSQLNAITIGASVDGQLGADHKAEREAIANYNKGIRLSTELADNGTRELLEDILEDEEEHIDWIEAQLDQIKQMGLEIYLGEQLS